jgi:hypothetical protein
VKFARDLEVSNVVRFGDHYYCVVLEIRGIDDRSTITFLYPEGKIRPFLMFNDTKLVVL